MKTKQEIQAELDGSVNELLKAHRGRVEITERVNGTAYVSMTGGCQGCAGARHTLKLIVERAIQAIDPTITVVIDVTNHDEGKNPFFKKE